MRSHSRINEYIIHSRFIAYCPGVYCGIVLRKTLYLFSRVKSQQRLIFDYIVDKHPNKELNQVQPSWFSDYQEYFLDSELLNFTLSVFPEFSEQTDSYHRGLVVYQINEDSVWSSVTVDSTLLNESLF